MREDLEVLIEAIATMRRRGRTVTCLIVGDCRQRDRMRKRARELGVAEHVVFTGDIPFNDTPSYYAQMDLLVASGIDEPAARLVSPMAPLEAMAMNVPVLVADLPALTEIARSEQCARTFRAGNAASLAAAATRLIDAPEERRRLAARAGSWVRRERSWYSVATASNDAYDEVLTVRPRK